MPIERGKIREFARATKSRHPAYFDGENPVSPPTFLMASAFWLEAVNEPMAKPRDRARTLHGEQEFAFRGEPPRAGIVLTGRKRLERSYERTGRRGGAMLLTVFVTEFVDVTGHVVAETRMTVIETGDLPVLRDSS